MANTVTGDYMELDGKVLDLQQEKLVKEKASYLCIAGAGSGKTFTIIAKIKYYLDCGIEKDKILVIAYTRLSALEITKRLRKENIEMKIYTFHSLAYSVINKPVISQDDYKYIRYSFLNEESKLFMKVLKKEPNHKYAKDKLLTDLETSTNNILVNGYDIHKIRSCFHDKKFYHLLVAYYYFYLAYLKQNKLVDFPTIITEAIGKIKRRFDYVMVDEFQDISKNRFLLVNSIVKRNKAKLYCFGDDYQSIYMFSGSKIEYFLDFEKYTGISNKIFLLNTYRNSKQLLFIANSFIQKNNYQIKKQLYSTKSLKTPIIILYYEMDRALKYIMEEIEDKQSLLILMRYSFSINKLVGILKKHQDYYTYRNYQNKITCLTIHKAKGLEADNVLIIDLTSNKYGFPSKIKRQADLLRLNNYREIKYAEERRLFYVALTRTRNKVFLLTEKKHESCFIKEIKRYSNIRVLK